ncbi:MAG: hypothetical protein H5T76_31910 [Streptomyces sp.]|nr:hypothetical protein [Streptomyces sp.]
MIPVWILWFLAASWISGPEPTDNDPMVRWLPIAAIVVVPCALLWTSVNRSLARRSSLARAATGGPAPWPPSRRPRG